MINHHIVVMHLLRYVGSKHQLLNDIEQRISNIPNNIEWIEPFCGSLVVSLHFLKKSPVYIRHFHVNDLNTHLIRFFTDIQNITSLSQTEQIFKQYIQRYEQDSNMYYELRNTFNDSQHIPPHEYIALFLFINRTCFNGVSRYNKSGKFNVPLGKIKPNWIEILKKLNEVHHDLHHTYRHKITFYNLQFDVFIKERLNAAQDTKLFVYCDPPYDNTFNTYNKTSFEKDDQHNLFTILHEDVHQHNNLFLVHNSNNERIQSLYNAHHQHIVTTRRSVSQQVSSRGIITELIITNYT